VNFYLCLLIVALVTGGIYSLLQAHLIRLIVGFILLSNAANLILFVAGGVGSRVLPIVQEGSDQLDVRAIDPVPQALILTAIVIGFGMLSFLVLLCRKYYQSTAESELNVESFE
jgi:multicomponent Na+:H+ antiporter subunit C